MPSPLLHREPIEWPDNCYFFLTVSTFLHYPYFQEPDQKQIVFNAIKHLKQKWNIQIQAYAILINHLHLIFYLKEGRYVTSVKRFIKSSITREYKRKFSIKYKEFWSSIRVLWIQPKDDIYWAIQGYVIGNLLKHREVSTFNELYQDPFNSFQYIADKHGFDFACNIVREVIIVDENADGEVELNGLRDCVSELRPRAG